MDEKKEVIVICGNKMVRISAKAFDLVMNAAGQMSDDWEEHHRELRVPKKERDAGFDALNRLSGITT